MTDGSPLAGELRERIRGTVRFDPLARTIYSSDASIYEITPLGVVLPKHIEDVVTTVHACRRHGVSLIARGAGTGLTGGAVGSGVQLDLSRHMNRIGPIDPRRRTVEVEPGVVLDELNAALASHGMHFAPDVATSSRATIGGMIANNSCGAHSIRYGRTVDHVHSLRVVLADGEVVTFQTGECVAEERYGGTDGRVRLIAARLSEIRDTHYEEIAARFPQILRSNGGYGLDRLGPPGTPADPIRILCGSEGTLGIMVGAVLALEPIPRHKAMVVLHVHELLEALAVVPHILKHNPAAVELVDRMILDAGRASPATRHCCGFLQGEPEAILVVELFEDDAHRLSSRLDELIADPAARGASYAAPKIVDTAAQRDVWEVRKAGLGLLMSKLGDHQPYAFVEDTAVPPARLRAYIERLRNLLAREDVTAGYYAHASVGCLHVRPVLNLKQASDVQRMGRIAEAVCDLAMEFGGTMTGEHGDGLLRSCWLKKLYGPRIIGAFKQVKELFDPGYLLNPGKIVDPLPMTQHLRFGSDFAVRQVKTTLDFSAYGGPAGLAAMCSGVGACRQKLVGTMCPSYMATGDETHTTRARANALRVALSNRGLLDGLDDPHLEEVLDLCLACKACKSECPTGVDMARLKAEFQSHRNLRVGVGPAARLVADLPLLAAQASRVPRLANWLAQSRSVRALVERWYGFDRRVPPPRFANRTFRSWFRKHLNSAERAARRRGRGQHPVAGEPERTIGGEHSTPRVVYFVDTWTNYFVPHVGIAAVRLFERAGYAVICPPTLCCGRPAISKGLLTEARQIAEHNVRILAAYAAAGVPIVGTEPSCILTLVDEYPQMVRTRSARRVSAAATMIESFLVRALAADRSIFRFSRPARPVIYHGHCYQKALVGASDAVSLMEHAWGDAGSEINSGCCGMAGVFGHEKAHYEVARAVGEQRLFPAVRGRGEADVAVSGFSCRQQIEHHTGARARHLIEYVANLLE